MRYLVDNAFTVHKGVAALDAVPLSIVSRVAALDVVPLSIVSRVAVLVVDVSSRRVMISFVASFAAPSAAVFSSP